MNKNDLAVFAIFDFLYLLVACVAASLFGFLAVWGVNLFAEVSFAVKAAVRGAILAGGATAVCGFLAYRDGYRYAAFSLKDSLLSAGIAAAVHFGLGLATRFAPLFFGAPRYLSGLFAFGGYFEAERIKRIPFGTLAVVGAILALVYVGVFILFGKLGCARRLRDREETVTGAKPQ